MRYEYYGTHVNALIDMVHQFIRDTVDDEMKWEKISPNEGMAQYHGEFTHASYEFIAMIDGTYVLLTPHTHIVVTKDTITTNGCNKNPNPELLHALSGKLQAAIEAQLTGPIPLTNEATFDDTELRNLFSQIRLNGEKSSDNSHCPSLITDGAHVLHHMTTSTLAGIYSWRHGTTGPTCEMYRSNDIEVHFVSDMSGVLVIGYDDRLICVNGDESSVTKQIITTLREVIKKSAEGNDHIY